MKRIALLAICILIPLAANSAPPSRTDTYVSQTTIDPAAVTRNEDAMFTYLQAGVDTLANNSVASANITDGTIVNADISSSAAIVGSKLDLSAPGAIGATTASAGTFTTVTATTLTGDGSGITGIAWIDGGGDVYLTTTTDNVGIGNSSPASKLDVTGTATFNDVSNEELVVVDNDGTGNGIRVQQDGVLASSKYGLYVHSDAIQANSPLVRFYQDNASSTQNLLTLTNEGTGSCLNARQDTNLASNQWGFQVESAVAQTTGDGLGNFNLSHASSTIPLLSLTNSGTGDALTITQSGVSAAEKHALDVTSLANRTNAGSALVYFLASSGSEPVLEIGNDGSGVQIQGQGNENLSAAGVWTDRSSTFADKDDIEEIVLYDFVDKLKSMKIYSYRKKAEVYGPKKRYDENGKEIKKKNRKYPKDKIRPNAKKYVGLILDDPTTPEELISRDLEGNINGKSGTQIAEFLLGVCKELITRIEVLEAR